MRDRGVDARPYGRAPFDVGDASVFRRATEGVFRELLPVGEIAHLLRGPRGEPGRDRQRGVGLVVEVHTGHVRTERQAQWQGDVQTVAAFGTVVDMHEDGGMSHAGLLRRPSSITPRPDAW